MFGNIIVDKLRFYFFMQSEEERREILTLKEHIEGVLKKHYATNAFSVWRSRHSSQLHVWFTPSRYFDDVNDIGKYTDTNLEMIEENKLLQLFEEIFSAEIFKRVKPVCKMTAIDLTKNILTFDTVIHYLDDLHHWAYKNRFKAFPISSEGRNKTICVSTMARNEKKKDTTGDRELKCYDKVRQLGAKYIYEVVLKQPLSIREQNIPFVKLSYIEETNTLILDRLRILRMEWQFSGKKIPIISKYLNLDDSEQGFSMYDFLSLLKKGELYKSLNDFYIDYTNKVIGLGDSNNKKLNIYTSIIADYYDKIQPLNLLFAFKNNGLGKQYNNIKRQAQDIKRNKRIEEILYKIKNE